MTTIPFKSNITFLNDPSLGSCYLLETTYYDNITLKDIYRCDKQDLKVVKSLASDLEKFCVCIEKNNETTFPTSGRLFSRFSYRKKTEFRSGTIIFELIFRSAVLEIKFFNSQEVVDSIKVLITQLESIQEFITSNFLIDSTNEFIETSFPEIVV